MPGNAELPPKTRGLTAIAGAMSLIAVLLIVQIWLLSAALEVFLAASAIARCRQRFFQA